MEERVESVVHEDLVPSKMNVLTVPASVSSFHSQPAATVNTAPTLLPQGSYMYLSSPPAQQTATSVDNPQPLVYLGSPNDQQKILSTITPVLVLANSDNKGTMEANVMLENNPSTFIRLSGQLQNIQAMAQANLIAQTQEHIAKQLGSGEVDLQSKAKDESSPFVSLENTCPDGSDSGNEKGNVKGGKIYLCEMEGCGKTFASAGYRKFHQTAQGHIGSSRALQCPFEDCGRKFARPAHFKYHQLTHTDNRQYLCGMNNCDKRFFTAQRLKVHMRTHTGEKPFLCGDCGKSFTTAGNLKNHERIHTGERPFACDYEGCTRKFTECSSLKKHKLVHTGEKPFTCNICLKTFSQSGSRKVHMKRHEVAAAASAAVSMRRERNELTSNTNTSAVSANQDHDGDNVKSNTENQKMVIVHEFPTHFHDPSESESIVLPQGLSDHVVTVTTQPAEGDSEKMDLTGSILEPGALVRDTLHPEDLQSQDKGVSVVVLSQPQDMVNLTSPYHQTHIPGREEIVYETDLLHTDLDHEEIAHSEFSLQSLTQGSQGATDMGVGDGIMVSDPSLTEHGDISSSSQAGREMAMDPMMESDDDTDHAEETKDQMDKV